MSISSVNSNYSSNTAANETNKTAKAQKTETANNTNTSNSTDNTKNEAVKNDKKSYDTGVVYKKSKNTKKDSANTIYNKDAVIQKLKTDQESRAASLQGLVEKLLNKQKGTFDLASGTNLAVQFRQAASVADADTIRKAQEDISEDGYWGVNKTSDRLVSMAIALSGGDTDKADEMMNAIQKGFDKATKAWGEELPEISKKTLEATKQKMNDWKNGLTTAEDYAGYLS